MAVKPSIRSNRKALLGTAAVVFAALVIAYLLGPILLVFGLSGVFAFVLLPVVKILERVMPS